VNEPAWLTTKTWYIHFESHLGGIKFHQPSIRPTTAAMILLWAGGHPMRRLVF
jgi:hypothetical protein